MDFSELEICATSLVANMDQQCNNYWEEWKITLDGRKKNGWLENCGHKDQSIDNIFQDKICQPSNNLASGSKVWEKTVFDSMVCTSRVECQTVWFPENSREKGKWKGKKK